MTDGRNRLGHSLQGLSSINVPLAGTHLLIVVPPPQTLPSAGDQGLKRMRLRKTSYIQIRILKAVEEKTLQGPRTLESTSVFLSHGKKRHMQFSTAWAGHCYGEDEKKPLTFPRTFCMTASLLASPHWLPQLSCPLGGFAISV